MKKTILAIIFVILLCACNSGPDQLELFNEKLELAYQYISEQNYEQAILVFNEIIEIDPKNANAYMGIADAYTEMGDTEKAAEILQAGYEATASKDIRTKLDEYISGKEKELVRAEEIPEDNIDEGLVRIDNGNLGSLDASQLKVVYDSNEKYDFGDGPEDMFWVCTSTEFILPPNYTLYVYYGEEKIADEIPLSIDGYVVTWNDELIDKIYEPESFLGAPPATIGDYIYYRLVEGTAFNGVSVRMGPKVPSEAVRTSWITDGRVKK